MLIILNTEAFLNVNVNLSELMFASPRSLDFKNQLSRVNKIQFEIVDVFVC